MAGAHEMTRGAAPTSGGTLTKEAQNEPQIHDYRERGPCTMGPWTSHIWRSDPRHLAFLLARYKFVAKMLEGKGSVLEVGCGDAFGTQVVLQAVGQVHGLDFEPLVLRDAEARYQAEGCSRVRFSLHDVVADCVPGGPYDAAYSLDVIEHIPAELEQDFLRHIVQGLKPSGVLILGTPNVTASAYASPASLEGHINLKSARGLKEVLQLHFENVFSFSMNDEVVHTGYGPMAHYLFAVGCGLRR